MTVNHGWIAARRAIIFFLSSLLSFLFFFLLSLSLSLPLCLFHGGKREKYRGGKNAAVRSHFPFSTAQCTRQKHPLNIGVYGPRREKGARVKPPWSFGHLSTFAAYSFYLSLPIDFSLSLSLFLSLLPPRFSLHQWRTHTHTSIPLISFSSSLFGPYGRFSVSLSRSRTPMRSILASIFFLAGNTRTIKGTARQKYCPPLRKRHGNFNASAIPPALAFPSAMLPVQVRAIRASSRRRYHGFSPIFSRTSLSLPLARFTSIRPSSFRPSFYFNSFSLSLVQNLL